MVLKKGQTVDANWLTKFLGENGYGRSETVMEPGEFAVRGGLVDLFPPGTTEPLRLDLFGDVLEEIRSFDPMSQRSTGAREEVVVLPVSEVLLTKDSIARFRGGYRELFGNATDDALYEAVSAGQRHVGMEHWLPLFHERLETLLDYCAEAVVTADHQIAEAFEARHDLITDYYDARLKTGGKGGMSGAADYKPVPPERIYLKPSEWDRLLEGHAVGQFTSFDAAPDAPNTIDLAGRRHEGFARARTAQGVNLFDVVAEHVKAATPPAGACWSRATPKARPAACSICCRSTAPRRRCRFPTSPRCRACRPARSASPCGRSSTASCWITWRSISEEDIIGDRLSRPAKKRRPSERFIAEAAALSEGDLVVHREHGVGRYEGLVTLEIQNARHDCLRLTYEGGDKLFVPVENIDVLSRYGSAEEGAALDRLGGVAWQSRKARLKQRIADMADRLIKIAAERAIRRGETMSPPEGAYEEFCARFPYAETDDQLQAISDVLDDMSSGKPMDRLVCGDVGFGKTEVALRAAFVAALSGKQVAVIAPTTLLARQHHRTFASASRACRCASAACRAWSPPRRPRPPREAVKEGTVDIVIGTHALLAKSVEFKDLGLLIVDEEQHFGVSHKERLKELRADVHVLTLTATPIPRTLQLRPDRACATSSLIATPPVDRLAVRTFVTPFDGVTIREALLREQYRGGQSFYVCPRIEDSGADRRRAARAGARDPRWPWRTAGFAPTTIENTMQDFVEGKFDVLFLDQHRRKRRLDHQDRQHHGDPSRRHVRPVQLYQLRGRIGRGKMRAYAYFHRAAGQRAERGALSVRGGADPRHLRRGFPARQPRPRHPRRRQPSGEATVRPHPRDRHRTLPATPRGGGRSRARAGARGRARRLVAATQSRHPGADSPSSTSPTCRCGWAYPSPGCARRPGRDRLVRCRLYRPASARCRPRPSPAQPVALKCCAVSAASTASTPARRASVCRLHDNQFARPEKLIAWLQKNAPLVRLRPDHRVIVQRRLERRAPAAFGRDVDRLFLASRGLVARGLRRGRTARPRTQQPSLESAYRRGARNATAPTARIAATVASEVEAARLGARPARRWPSAAHWRRPAGRTGLSRATSDGRRQAAGRASLRRSALSR